jgi:hypothetical protein
MHYEKYVEEKRALAIFLGLLIIGLSFMLSIHRSPETGQISINVMPLILGVLLATLIYIALTFTGFRGKFLIRLRFCVNCGRSIPFDAIICPYCRYDYRKNFYK